MASQAVVGNLIRAADRIKIVVGSFPAKTFWRASKVFVRLKPFMSTFPTSKANVLSLNSNNEPSVQAIFKKAVVKKLQKHYARPEEFPWWRLSRV